MPDKNIGSFTFREEALPDIILKNFDFIPKTGKVLDIGFGYHPFSFYFGCNGWEVLGIDKSEEMVRSLKYFSNVFGLENIEVERGLIEEFEFSDNEFSLIIISEILHLMSFKKAKKLVENLRRSLTEDGLIYISVTSNKSPQLEDLKGTKMGTWAVNNKNDNQFHNTQNEKVIHFFTKEYFDSLISSYSKFETSFHSKDDKGFSENHFEFIGRK